MLSNNIFQFILSFAQNHFGRRPVYARIGHRNAVLELRAVGGNRLFPRLDVAFNHEANDGTIARAYLLHAIAQHNQLQEIVLVGIGMAAIHHDVAGQLIRSQFLFALPDALNVVIRLGAAAQHHMRVTVPPRANHGAASALVDSQKTVRMGHRKKSVNCHLEAAVGAVFETDWR